MKAIALLLLFSSVNAWGSYSRIFNVYDYVRLAIPEASGTGDCDGDGVEEMVMGVNPNLIVIRSGGVIEETITLTHNNSVVPVLYDFNQDGVLDIIVGRGLGGVYVEFNEVYSFNASETAEAQDLPRTVQLQPAYPNPFNPATTIDFSLDNTEQVRLVIHNLQGQQVAVVLDELLGAGQHSAAFDGAGLASGVYTYTLQAGGFSQTKTFSLVK